MRTLKTIRKMTPLARKLAHLTRALHSVEKRMGYLTEAVLSAEVEASANEKWIADHAAKRPRSAPERGPLGLTASELEQGPEAPGGCEVDGPGDGGL
jgi:hypothetical protein